MCKVKQQTVFDILHENKLENGWGFFLNNLLSHMTVFRAINLRHSDTCVYFTAYAEEEQEEDERNRKNNKLTWSTQPKMGSRKRKSHGKTKVASLLQTILSTKYRLFYKIVSVHSVFPKRLLA